MRESGIWEVGRCIYCQGEEKTEKEIPEHTHAAASVAEADAAQTTLSAQTRSLRRQSRIVISGHRVTSYLRRVGGRQAQNACAPFVQANRGQARGS